MAVYSISYDLHNPGQNYEDLHETVKDFGGWWHHLESTWLVDTSSSASDIAEELHPYLDSNDELLVTRLSGEWASWGINESGNDWLQEHL
ncbi:hypothetical protein GCM10009000_108480 [Halobacterium noricense]